MAGPDFAKQEPKKYRFLSCCCNYYGITWWWFLLLLNADARDAVEDSLAVPQPSVPPTKAKSERPICAIATQCVACN